MSLSIQRKAFPGSELIIIDQDETVAIGAVEEQLTLLWRNASEYSQGDQENGLALARLWNLVCYQADTRRPASATPADSSSSAQNTGGASPAMHNTATLLEEVTVSLPARVIHLEDRRNDPLPPGEREVEARVGSHCIVSKSGSRMVCCESVTLVGRGEAGHSHFPAVVRALLVPHLPVALLWLDEVPRRGRLLGELLRISDRMIIDTMHTSDANSLLAVHDLMGPAGDRMVDLGWLRLRPLRYLLAEFFDAPGRAEQLKHLESIKIETSFKGFNSGLMLAGWLLSRCGLTHAREVTPGAEGRSWRWNIQTGEGAFPLDFSIREGYGGLDEIFRIAIRAGGDVFEIQDIDPDHVSVTGPDREVFSVALREEEDADLVVTALGGQPEDSVFSASLSVAAHLVEALQWNQ